MRKATVLRDLSYWSVFLACALLPLKTTLSNSGLILLFSLSVFSLLKDGVELELLKSPKFYLNTTLLLFAPIAIGCLYAIDVDKALGEMGKNVFYFLLPIVTLRKDIEWKKMLSIGIYGLAIGCLVSMIYLHSINLYNFQSSGLPLTKLFSYKFTGLSFIEPIKDMHNVYIGVYYLILLVAIWQQYITLKDWMKFTLSTMIIITILFLNSRSVFLVSVLLLVVYGFSVLNYKKSILGLVLIGVILILTHPFYKKTYVYNKLVNGTYWELTENVDTNNTDTKQTADSRMSRWIVALDFIKERPMFVYGTDSEKDMLLSGYKNREMKISESRRYDSHNQYLSYALQYGIFGLGILMLFLISNLIRGLRHNDKILVSFILIIAVVSLTENFLNRNMGVNFVVLFSTLLFNLDQREC